VAFRHHFPFRAIYPHPCTVQKSIVYLKKHKIKILKKKNLEIAKNRNKNSKIAISVKIRNFGQESKFSSKIEIFLKNRFLDRKSKFWPKKSKFSSKNGKSSKTHLSQQKCIKQ